jgi:hypothetical protein
MNPHALPPLRNDDAAAKEVARRITGTGGPVGVTTDGRAVPLTAEGVAGEFPVFRWSLAPAGLATRRQLRACGLRPGGVEPVARIEWSRYGQLRFADLYRVDAAKPVRPMSPAKWAAVAAAVRARRICHGCGHDVGYVLPRTWPSCWDCQNGTPAHQHEHEHQPSHEGTAAGAIAA